MNWQPSYALLLFSCTIITYVSGLAIERKGRGKKYFLWSGIILNLGILVFFKYYQFLGEIMISVLETLDLQFSMPRFQFLLPVGISFFIFQALGYMIDVYQKKIIAVTDFFDYALFVSFFPQLVAGPIERTGNLIPQFNRKHTPDYNRIVIGLYWMLWGYFLKLVLADNCAVYVDAIFGHMERHNGGTFILAAILFTFQIYGDFAGYSLIAIGAAKIMGFNLMENFRRPYFSGSISEFWKRWHISLSTWMRDYIYIPLGGNRVGRKRHLFNLMTTFAISGLWHGADYNFLVWGLYHGTLSGVESHIKKKRKRGEFSGKKNFFISISAILITFVLVVVGWIIFRVDSLDEIVTISKAVTTDISWPYWDNILIILPIIITIVFLKDLMEERNFSFERILTSSFANSVIILTALFALILLLGNLSGAYFIYFQF